MNKPIKPEITIPESFAENGIKTDFTAEQIQNGFDNLRPDVLAGDNLNKFIDDTYKGLNYGMAAADAVNLINEDEILTVKDGQFVSTKNINTELLNNKADKTELDGDFTENYKVLHSGTWASNTDIEFDLSDVLPDDNNDYEISISAYLNTKNVAQNSIVLKAGTSILNYDTSDGVYLGAIKTVTAAQIGACAFATLPVGVDRILKIHNGGNGSGNSVTLKFHGYRKYGSKQ